MVRIKKEEQNAKDSSGEDFKTDSFDMQVKGARLRVKLSLRKTKKSIRNKIILTAFSLIVYSF